MRSKEEIKKDIEVWSVKREQSILDRKRLAAQGVELRCELGSLQRWVSDLRQQISQIMHSLDAVRFPDPSDIAAVGEKLCDNNGRELLTKLCGLRSTEEQLIRNKFEVGIAIGDRDKCSEVLDILEKEMTALQVVESSA